MIKNINLLSLSFCLALVSYGQVDSLQIEDEEYGVVSGDEESGGRIVVYEGTRVINGHSVETLEKNTLEFRVEHRFGDVAGENGGIQTMFGFDNSSDIRLGFEYGITDRLMMGIGRSKGTSNPYRSLIDGFAKYKVLQQAKDRMPVSMAVLGTTSFTYMEASTDPSLVSSFPKWEHRLAYSLQMNIARRFGSWLSLSLSPTMVHRNYVADDDVNTLFALGGSARVALSPTVGIIVEYFHNFNDNAIRTQYTNSLGIAVEFVTFGHNFTINFTNSKGFGETQFIPYTASRWEKGQFRLGFTIGRKFAFGE